MRRMIIAVLYRCTVIAPRFFLRKIVFLIFVLNELAWYLLNKIDSHAALRYREETIDFVLDNIASGERVLDAGSAEGYLSTKIMEKAGFLFGIEVDKAYFQRLERMQSEKMKFINDDIETVELEDTYDTAVLVHVLEHIKDPKKLLSKLSLRARKLIVEVPCETEWWLSKLKKDLHIRNWADEHHMRTFTRKNAVSLLTECGWKITDIREPVMLLRLVAHSTHL